MQKLQYLTIASAAAIGLALAAPQSAHAAALQICDAPSCGAPEGSIDFNVNDFENGFQVNSQTVQQGLGHPVSFRVSESGGPNPINGSAENDFSGVWIIGGPITPQNETVFFTEPGAPAGTVSDVLHYTYTQADGFGHLDGSVISDLEGNLTVANLNAAGIVATRTVAEALGVFPFDFSNTNITASFISDVEVPEPTSLALLGGSLFAFGAFRRRRRQERI